VSAVGSYDDTLPTERDVIRATLGDTNGDDFLLSDALIDAARAMQGSVSAAVAWLARSLIARYATEPTRVTADGVTVDYSERLAVWRALITDATTHATGGAWGTVSADFGDGRADDEFARPPRYWP
jgi:hypothetical protein